MLIGYFDSYRGYNGTIEYSYEDGLYYGWIQGIRDFVNYEGKDVLTMRLVFHQSVDNYLGLNRKLLKEQDENFGGKDE